MSQAVWGVDVGEAKLALAMLDPGGTATSLEFTFAEKRDPRRFNELLERARGLMLAGADVADPLAVFVELPTGRFTNPWLTGAWAIACAAAVVLDGRYPHQVPVFSIGVSEWKKLTLGNGQAKKEQIVAWARAEGFAGESQDGCDAYAIARAGRMMLDRSARWAA